MNTITSAWNWVLDNPGESLQVLLILWGVVNVIWAQIPKPKDPRAQRVWMLIHHVLLLAVTSSRSPGTFTWPSVMRAIGGELLSSPDPFADPTQHVSPPVHVTIKNVGDETTPTTEDDHHG